ncbi:MAG: response regulator transcription factor [Nitrospira sp.]
MAAEPFNVVLGDDGALVRARLRAALTAVPGIGVVAEASDTTGTIELIRSVQPALVIVDLMMPGGGGLAVLRWMQEARVNATRIVWTNWALPEYRARCQRAGANYLFDKSYDLDALIRTVRSLLPPPGNCTEPDP